MKIFSDPLVADIVLLWLVTFAAGFFTGAAVFRNRELKTRRSYE